ncbi:DUF4407 domain-containing protein [Nocardia flavorosea]|uniref:DUF4407 domain-containing protein n=1 Tax=Nocardia flavorosea TaxID=53429 RepID=UPI001896369E|nr:DUF4407 domain-containing protein [Nocardia flavorosea]MBF6350074.1 DUF4407 domain-containing protein [Nocardia flavorosea]
MSVTGMFIWLGGGQPTETTDGYERTGYTVTGTGVALFALVSAGITGVALGRAEWPAGAILLTALLTGLLLGLVGRALAGAQPAARPDRPAGTTNVPAVATRVAVIALTGLVVAELATTVLFDGSVDRILDERAGAAAATAPAVRSAQDELDRAVADRTALDRDIAEATADIDDALVVARCEFNPTPACPQTKITGVPGRGPEAQTANDMLDDARTALSAAQSRVDPLDRRVADARTALDGARTTAAATGDRGIGARWAAMHEYTTGQAGAFLLRLLSWAVFILLAALPLILRRWRGETMQERRRAAAAVADRAERAADAAIAAKEAEVRAETAAVQADRQLAAARLEAEADTAITRARERTRVIAALGGLEIGVTERAPEPGALPAEQAALPAGAGSGLPAPPAKRSGQTSRGLELPLVGTVPFTDTAARLIGPLVPGFVSSAIEDALDSASRPLRTARQVFTEAEEITFTLRRSRNVTVDGVATQALPDRDRESGSPARNTVVDAELTLDPEAIVSATTHLEPATGTALPGRTAGEPAEGRNLRELPPGN